MALAERSRRILATLVTSYVETGEPVASRTVQALGGFGVSAATIRNELAALEEAGYVRQPHTSAGRVPTDQGYRAYVDWLLEERRAPRVPARVEAQLRRHADTPDDALWSSASRLLSDSLHHVAFALARARRAVFVQGTWTLVEAQSRLDLSLATLRTLLSILEQKDRLIRLISDYVDGTGLRVVIGREHRVPDLRETSLVAITFDDAGQTGTVGVLGPTRMRYWRAIAAVEATANAMTRVLGTTH